MRRAAPAIGLFFLSPLVAEYLLGDFPVTMLPALIFIAIGVDPTQTLVISQVVLSFVLPFAIVPLLYFTSRRDVMRSLVNHRVTRILGWGVAAAILVLNAVLLYTTFGGRL